MNPFGISGSWRIDPDNRQDRGCSEVKSYKLSPEEIDALLKNAVKPVAKIKTEVDDMRKITVEQLTEECRKLGFNAAAYEDIAKRYGFANAHSIECIVSKKGIKKLLESEGKKQEPKTTAAVAKPKAVQALETNEEQKSEPVKTETELEFEVLDKIKAIVAENKRFKAVCEENEVLKDRLASVEILLRKILVLLT